MKNKTVAQKDNQANEPIVIADECGDSMWDAVLGQEVKACQIIEVDKNPEALINRIENVQESDATEAE